MAVQVVRERLVRFVAPHFVAGFVTNGRVTRAAPIIKYIVGWPDDRVREYCRRKGWSAKVVDLRAGR